MNEHAADVLPLNAAPGEAQCVSFTLSSCCVEGLCVLSRQTI